MPVTTSPNCRIVGVNPPPIHWTAESRGEYLGACNEGRRVSCRIVQMRSERTPVLSTQGWVSLLSAAVLVALAAAGSPAWGCSVIAVAATPTNYEIVREAEAIVLARSVHWEPSVDKEQHW